MGPRNFPFWGCRAGCDARRPERRVASHTSEEQRRSAPAMRPPKREISRAHVLTYRLIGAKVTSTPRDVTATALGL